MNHSQPSNTCSAPLPRSCSAIWSPSYCPVSLYIVWQCFIETECKKYTGTSLVYWIWKGVCLFVSCGRTLKDWEPNGSVDSFSYPFLSHVFRSPGALEQKTDESHLHSDVGGHVISFHPLLQHCKISRPSWLQIITRYPSFRRMSRLPQELQTQPRTSNPFALRACQLRADKLNADGLHFHLETSSRQTSGRGEMYKWTWRILYSLVQPELPPDVTSKLSWRFRCQDSPRLIAFCHVMHLCKVPVGVFFAKVPYSKPVARL